MHPEVAKAALAFLARVDLKGAEVPALMQVLSALEIYVNPQLNLPAAAPVPSEERP